MKKLLSLSLALALCLGLTAPVSAATNTLESLIIKSNLDYAVMYVAEEGFIRAMADINGDKIGDKTFLLDSNGIEIIIPSGYEIARDRGIDVTVSEGMVIVKQTVNGNSDKFGFMDTSGNLAVPAKYDRVHEFSEGLAAVYEIRTYQDNTVIPGMSVTMEDCKIGFIDKTGKTVIPMIYEDVSSTTTVWTDARTGTQKKGFSEGLISVKKDGKWGVIDKQGNTVIAFKYDLPIGSFHNGLASYSTGGKSGFINQSGKVVISAAYDYVRDFVNGYAIVANYDRTSQHGDMLYGAINTQGKLVVPIKYLYMSEFHDGMACVSDQSYGAGKYGYVNTCGTLVVPIQYTTAHSFSNGLAMVAVEDERFSAPVVQARYGYINTQGKTVIPLKYSYATSFSNGIAAVHLNMPDHIGFMGSEDLVAQFDGKPEYIYLDTNGNEVLSHGTEYGEISFFGKIGVIRQADGKYAIVKNPCYGGATTPATVGNFTDVLASAYYADAVKWAVEKNITSGTSATTFSPDVTCTTAQILTFLWRASGSPEPTIENPFSDIMGTDYYAKAALWAHEKELISGDTFAGATPCTRSMTVTYLWKLADNPTAGNTNFTDVPASADYAKAVAWAVDKKITSGTSATTFSPDATCTRGQIATFLYRNFSK